MTVMRLALLVLSLLWMGNAQAQLAAISYDRGSSATFVASVNEASGVLTNQGPGSAGCCEFGLGVNAFDPFAQIAYGLGPDPSDASAAWLLYGFDVISGNPLAAVTLGQTGRIVGAVFEQTPPRLLVLQVNATNRLELYEVNAASGAMTLLNAGVAGADTCCELQPNAVAYRLGTVYFIGTVIETSVTSLFAFPVGGAAVTVAPVTDVIVAMVGDRSSGQLYGLRQVVSGASSTLQLVEIDNSTGAISALGAPLAACCSVVPDLAAISNGALTTVVQQVASSDYEFLSFDLGTGAGTFSAAPIDPTRIVNGLFDAVKGLQPSTTTITSIAPSPSGLGQNYTVSVSVTAGVAVTGTVIVSDGLGATCTITLPATSCVLASSTAGPLTVSAVYGGAPGLAGSGDTAAHTVTQAASTTTITSVAPAGSSTVGNAYTVNVAVAGFGVPTGTVVVDDGLGAMCSITLPATSCMLTSTTAGAITIGANYSGDANNTASGDTVAYTISRAGTMTAITSIVPAGSSPVGAPYAVNVTVSGGFGVITGSVAVSDGTGATCSITLPATSCMLTSTTAGAKTISADYLGDTNNSLSGDATAYTIDQAVSVTTITSIAPAAMSTVGQPYTVNVSVTGFGTPTGTVVVDDGSGAMCSIVLPATSCALTSTTAGAKTITASYPGDTNNSPSSDTAAYLIDQETSTTTINSVLPNPGALGVPYTVSVTVTGFMPAGTVAVDDGTGGMCSIVLPAASCDLTSTVAGAKTVTASYPGDANNTASSDTAAQMIDLAPSTTTITSIAPAGSSTVGVAYTVNVSVTGFGVPVGTVAVDDGAGAMCSIVLPATSCMLTSTTAGAKTISASYPGDVNNNPSGDTAAYSISRAATMTSIDSIVPAGSSPVGAAYAVNVTVSGGFGVITGDVLVSDGSASCMFTLPATACMLTSTTVGAKTISADYLGDTNNSLSGAAVAYVIDQAASTTTITAITPPGSSIVGQAYSVDVSVTGFGTLTGTIAVDDGTGAMCTITLPATSCMLTSTTVGAKTISANYSGDTNNTASGDTQAYQIDQATSTTTITSVAPNPAGVGQPYAVAVSVTGFGPPTGTIAVDDGAGAMCSIVLPATSCDLTSTTTGPKTITASYPGDVSNLPSSDTAAQGIDPAASVTAITAITPAGSSVVGVAYTVDVSVTGFNPTGDVAVDDGTGAMCTITLPATSCMLTSTTAGAKTISASYPGDSNNLASGDTQAYTIDRAASTTVLTSIAPAGSSIVGVAYTVNVTVSGFGVPTGDIAVDDGTGAMCTITLPATSCMLTSTSTGMKTISAAYAGDSNNLPSADSAAYQIDPAVSTTTITAITPPGSSMVGQAYSVDVSVTGFGTLTGTVAVDDGAGAMCTITLPATSCMLTSTVVGAKTISANYSGDSNNLPSADTQAYQIDQATSTTTITDVTKNPAIVGQPYTVSVTVTGFGPPTGTIAVDDGDGALCSIVLPATSCDLTSTNTGPKTITASYPGDVNNLPSSDTAAQVIDPEISVTTITAITPAGSSVVGVAYSVDVSVTGFNPTGDVAVDDGTGATCTITLPATSCMLTSTTAGAKTISANYPGDVNNLASSDTQAYQIDLAASTTAITSIAPAGASIVGVAYTVNVAVTGFGTLTGDVAVDDGTGATCTITLPATNCMLTSTTAGAKTITAAYAGDGNNLPSSDTAAYQIDRAASATLVPSIVPDPPTAGMPYTVNVTVSGFGTPIGTITVDDGNGASCTITLPATSCILTTTVAGAVTLTASYSGDDNNLPSSASFVITGGVLQAATATVLTALPSPVIVGMPVQLNASVTQPGSVGVVLAGNVAFVEGAVAIPGCAAVPLVNGVAVCNTSFTPAGERTLSANYLGDANNLPSSGSAQLMVNRVPTTTTLTVLPTSTPINGLISLSVLVEGGVPPLSGTVSITANGVDIPECQNLTLIAGMTSCQYVALEVNEFVLVATYGGDVDDDVSSGSANLSVFAISVPVGGPWLALLLALSLLLIGGRALPKD